VYYDDDDQVSKFQQSYICASLVPIKPLARDVKGSLMLNTRGMVAIVRAVQEETLIVLHSCQHHEDIPYCWTICHEKN
jgi:hypothetical protein